ncbi:MAG: cation:proton antiporter [Chromatiaceae bacterium]|nr:cation:proton antiporter [Chromatiaceae bacterium]
MQMETLFAAIDYRDPIWIAVAFTFGFLAVQLRLPPLVGFLVAGFVLNALGAEGGAFLGEMADLGVTLLLFSIGLKLRIRQLIASEVWGVAGAHMALTTLLWTLLLMGLAALGVPIVAQLNWPSALLLGFALSFSSTVFAVKLLEDKDDAAAWYGRLSIGILIIQDIAAVIFLGVSTAKVPSPMAALMIVAIIAARPLLGAMLNRAGHGELQVLMGLVLALGGASLFELVDMKGDLGALVIGVLLAGHPKANELFKALLSLKDLFLVGFFLSIGMAGIPDLTMLAVASLLLLALPFKAGLFVWLLTRFRVRIRAAVLASQALTSFSEFGLIVGSIAVANGWLDEDWVVVLAIAVALSFVAASALNARADDVYVGLRARLHRFESRERLVGDEPLQFGDARIVLCGMGRVGSGAYDALAGSQRRRVIGVDINPVVVGSQRAEGRDVRHGNMTNPDFWVQIDRTAFQVEWILLAMPTLRANLTAARLAREWGFRGRIGATAKFPDEAQQLRRHGVDAVFDIYAEAGRGFADHAEALFSTDRGADASTAD